MNKQTVIGIVPTLDDGRLIPGGEIDRVYLRRDYLQAIAAAGALPIILHPEMATESIVEMCDGIIISGGADIDPKLYKQDQHETVTWLEPVERFHWETKLINECDRMSVPILGVCYGMQRLNIHYGGDLIQDIVTQKGTEHPHTGVMHEVSFEEPFLGLDANRAYNVNSRHHQALGIVAPAFTVRSMTPDGIVEAIEGNGHFGVQWHPESDSTALAIYGAFAAHCKTEESVALTDFLPEASPA